MEPFPESDWKTLRQIADVALERFCQRALDDVRQAATTRGVGAHDRFLAVLELLNRRNQELARGFDDMRRSRAFERILTIRALGLLGPDDLARFSDDTRGAIERLDRAVRSRP